jgi:hypothetical protein
VTAQKTNVTKVLGECDLGCWINSDCTVKGQLCARQNKVKLRKRQLSGLKAYCDNIKFARGQYACYVPQKTRWTMCNNVTSAFANGDTCNQTRFPNPCYVQDTFVCYRTIQRNLTNGNYKCQPRSCMYRRSGRCRSGRWNWGTKPRPRNIARNEMKCI